MPDLDTAAGSPAAAGPAPLQLQKDARWRTLLYVEDSLPNLLLVESLMERRPDVRLITARDGLIVDRRWSPACLACGSKVSPLPSENYNWPA